jgi:N-acetylglucosaminyldiphosphoundecaprenol N-acetyl-beta-D-mannosaminyltransferase
VNNAGCDASIRRVAAVAEGVVPILGCNVSCVTVEGALNRIEGWISEKGGRCHFVVATGFHGICEAFKDPRFRETLNSADLFCPDGIAPVWISRMRKTPLPARVPGPELLAGFAARGMRRGYRSFFFGDTADTLAALERSLIRDFPGHCIAGAVSPPFGGWTDIEDKAFVTQINAARPDVLWVGLGVPKQERWINRNRDSLEVPVAVGVGAAFRFVGGTVRRAPAWVGEAGFEWLWRLVMEPRKLWRRDLVDGPRFMYHALREVIAARAGASK